MDLFDLAAGNARLEFGVESVSMNNREFLAKARATAAILALRGDGLVDSDDLREWASRICIRPAHPNAWGAIFRGREWKPVGYKKSSLASNHARTIRLWSYQPD